MGWNARLVIKRQPGRTVKCIEEVEERNQEEVWDVSVIVPVYNAEKTLRKCLDSVLTQTMKNVQIVIVDDGSSDNSPQIIEEYHSRDPEHITVWHQPGNKGLSEARKQGIALAGAPYIGFVDSDDWVEPEYVETLYTLAKGRHGERVIACCGHWKDSTAASIPCNVEKGPYVFTPQDAFSQILKRRILSMYFCDKLFDIRLLQDLVFPTSSLIGEDFTIVSEVVLRADVILRTDKPLYHYIQAEGSMSKSGYGAIHKRSAENYKKLEEKYCAGYPECAQAMHHYIEIELLSFLVAMSRNQYYDKAMGKTIQSRTRKLLVEFLRDRNVARNYKAAAILTAINWKWFCRSMHWLQLRG